MADSTHLPPARRDRTVVAARGDRGAVIELQERLVDRALAAGASDLHVEPQPDRLRIRIRVDGRLHDLDAFPLWLHPGLVTRFKVLAEMDVAERRRPQDGRSSTRRRGSDPVDLRIATLPTQHGEKVVIRLLRRSRRPLDLVKLGLDEEGVGRLADFVEQPQGLILAVGPTGAGKTTTLYALLRRIDATARHVVTLEDPIEYTLPDIVQVPVRRAIGIDFAAALRAVLRQDPDVILVGEIRDEETARTAVRAAITGHLVLSSVHTNSAVESMARLRDLGVPSHLLASAVIGVVSQRLVRRLCSRCRAADTPSTHALAALALPAPAPGRSYWRGRGCRRCRGGYRGRVGTFEILAFDRSLRTALAQGADDLELETRALASGQLRQLGESVRRAVLAGITSAGEGARIVRWLPTAGSADAP